MTGADQAANPESGHEEWRTGMRVFPMFIFVFFILILFLGGVAAFLYWAFAEVSGVRNVWLLICGAPFVVLVSGAFIVYNLYSRYGSPLRQMFAAIDSVAKGDLSVRLPEDSSPQFGELIKRFNNMVGDLERSDQQRRNLTADIAHELRTPLHVIQGKLEGMLDGVYPAEPKHIDDALEETKLLTRLVNDLQTISLAESGQLPLHPSRFLLADLINDVKESFAPQASSNGIDLRTSIGDANLEITADYVRLNQVLSNLISNAIRYTPKGGSISLESETTGSGSTRITVKDTGVGIQAADLPFIFDRFWRGEKSRAREGHANSGLGLAIARQLIQAHKGTIDVQSVEGVGTKFVIELPAEKSD